MPRFFQYIDKNDESKWNNVTELAYIDDTDPDMIMYCFTDGYRCNKDFIGELNDTQAIGKYVMVEVENRKNIWKIEKKVLQYKERTATNANGETVTVPDFNMTDSNGKFIDPGTRYNFTPPTKTDKPVIPFTEYYLSLINNKLESGEHVNKDILKNIPKEILAAEQKEDAPEKVEKQIIENPTPILVTDNNAHTLHVNTNEPTFINVYNNDAVHYKINSKTGDTIIYRNDVELFNGTAENLAQRLAFGPQSKPEIEDEAKYNLVDKMIDAANKEECDVDLSLVLRLPPVDVYNVLKNVYGDEYAEMFVLNLAYNLPDDMLRKAIAEGLRSYYKSASSINEEPDNEPEYYHKVCDNEF